MKRNAVHGAQWHFALSIWCFIPAYIALVLRVGFDCRGTRIHMYDPLVLFLAGVTAFGYGLLLFAGLLVVVLAAERISKRRIARVAVFAAPPIFCAAVLLLSLALIPPRAYLCTLP
jgi:hypothetical protein